MRKLSVHSVLANHIRLAKSLEDRHLTLFSDPLGCCLLLWSARSCAPRRGRIRWLCRTNAARKLTRFRRMPRSCRRAPLSAFPGLNGTTYFRYVIHAIFCEAWVPWKRLLLLLYARCFLTWRYVCNRTSARPTVPESSNMYQIKT